MMKMTHQERDLLKRADFGDQKGQVITMISHWQRQAIPVPFSVYAAHWVAARADATVSRLREVWPLFDVRMIKDDCSDFNFAEYLECWLDKAEDVPSCEISDDLNALATEAGEGAAGGYYVLRAGAMRIAAQTVEIVSLKDKVAALSEELAKCRGQG